MGALVFNSIEVLFELENTEKVVIYRFVISWTILQLINSERVSYVLWMFCSSVFLRNCKECNVIVCCQQFRMRSCHKINILLHCATQPIIETSFKIKFACFHFFYGQLLSQMKAAGLSPFMNCWYNIHDFSPNTEDDGKPNHGYLSSSQVR